MNIVKTVSSRLIKSTPILMAIVGFSMYAAETTSENESPFHEFMRPKGAIDVLSGSVTFPLEIARITGRTDTTTLKLRYSSNVEVNVRADNGIAPTSWVGLGWSMGFGAIRCDHAGTVPIADDNLTWISAEGVAQSIHRMTYESKPDAYFLEKEPYWKVEPQFSDKTGFIEGWVLTDPQGKRYIYGMSDERKTVRYTFCWPATGYVGPGFSSGYKRFPYQWDLSAIEDIYGNRVTFEYEQDLEALTGPNYFSTGTDKYTKASYLREIENEQGDRIVIHTKDKGEDEYVDPRTAVAEPDAFYEHFETKQVESVEVLSGSGELQRCFVFCYKPFNIHMFGQVGGDLSSAEFEQRYSVLSSRQKRFTKSLLQSVTEYDRDGEIVGRTQFDYFDGLYALDQSGTDANADDTAYNFGALRKVTLPTCGSVEYRYARQEQMCRTSETTRIKLNKYLRDCFTDVPFYWTYQGGASWHNQIGSGTVEGDRPYFAIATADGELSKVITWVGDGWKTQNLQIVDNGIVFAGADMFIVFDTDHPSEWESNDVEDLYTVSDFNLYVWDKYAREWVYVNVPHNGFGTAYFLIPDAAMFRRNHISFWGAWPGGFKGDDYNTSDFDDNDLVLGRLDIEYDRANRTATWTLTEEASEYYENLQTAGTFFGARPGVSSQSKICLRTWMGESFLGKTELTFDGDVDEYEGGQKAAGDYLLVLSRKGGVEFLHVYRFDGTQWARVLKNKPCRNGDEANLYPATDFFAVYKPSSEKIDAYYWDGEKFKSIIRDKEYDNKAQDLAAAAGNDFFVVRVPKKIRKRCYNWRKMELFKLYQWDGGLSWDKEVSIPDKRLGLDKKSEKNFVAGRDFFAAVRRKNKKRTWQRYIRTGSAVWNGIAWSQSTEQAKSISKWEWSEDSDQPVEHHYWWGDVNDVQDNHHVHYEGTYEDIQTRYYDPSVIAQGRAALFYGLVAPGIEQGGTCNGFECYLEEVLDGHDCYDNLSYSIDVAARMMNSNALGGSSRWDYVVRTKIVRNTGEEDGSLLQPVEIVTTYEYEHPSYDLDLGTGMFAKTTVTLGQNGGSEIFHHHNGSYSKPDNDRYKAGVNYRTDRECAGRLARHDRLSVEGHLIERTDYTYNAGYRHALWPPEVHDVRLSHTLHVANGVPTTTTYGYAEQTAEYAGNGLPSKVTVSRTDGKAYVTETKFAHWEYSGMADCNMISQVCGTSSFELTGSGNRRLSSSVTTWRRDAAAGAWVHDKTYRWDVGPDPQGEYHYAEFDFSSGGENDPAVWRTESSFPKYSMRGQRLEEERMLDQGQSMVSAVYFGRQESALMAGVRGAKWGASAILTADYHESYEDAGIEYIDYANGWVSGGCQLEQPVVPLFGDRVLEISGTTGPKKTIQALVTSSDYELSCWVLPLSSGDGQGVSLQFLDSRTAQDPIPTDADFTDLVEGRWQRLERTIPKAKIDGIDPTRGEHVSVLVSSLNGLQFQVQDIRCHPANALVQTNYYDHDTRLPICYVDANGNDSLVLEYDSQERPIRQLRWTENEQGERVRTTLREYEYHDMRCNPTPVNKRLALLTVSFGQLIFDPDQTSYYVSVENSVEAVDVAAWAQSIDASVVMQWGTEQVGSVPGCPCSQSATVELLEGQPVTVTILVYPPAGLADPTPGEYTLTIRRRSSCWAPVAAEPAASEEATQRALFTAGQGPEPAAYLAFVSSTDAVVATHIGTDGTWCAPEAVSVGEADMPAGASDGTNPYVAYRDRTSADQIMRPRVAFRNALTGQWQQLGEVAATETDDFDIAVTQDGTPYVAYIDNGLVKVRMLAGSTWEPVPSPQDGAVSTDEAMSCQIVMDGNGTPYIAYSRTTPESEPTDLDTDEDDAIGHIHVYKYNGVGWEQVGTGAVIAAAVESYSLSLSAGTPYLAYVLTVTHEVNPELFGTATFGEVFVTRYDAQNQNWVYAGCTPAQPICMLMSSESVSLGDHAGTPLLCYSSSLSQERFSSTLDPMGARTTVLRFDGTVWAAMGNPAFGFAAKGVDRETSLSSCVTGTYVAYSDALAEKSTSVVAYEAGCLEATLTSLEVTSAGETRALFPAFAPYTVNYGTEMEVSDGSVTVKPTAVTNAQVFHGETVVPTTGLQVSIQAGLTLVPITVVAGKGTPDESSVTYSIAFFRPPSAFASLCGMEIRDQVGRLVPYTPDFGYTTLKYEATVGPSTESLVITPVSTDGLSVRVGTYELVAQASSGPISLEYGYNSIPIGVCAPGYQPRGYILRVTREPRAEDRLTGLDLSVAGLTPAFDPEVYEYTLHVGSTTSAIAVKAAASGTVRVDGIVRSTGVFTEPIALPYGNRVITVSHVATEGGDAVPYRILVTREPAESVGLDNLVLVSSDATTVELKPVFDAASVRYNATVPGHVTHVSVQPTLSPDAGDVVLMFDGEVYEEPFYSPPFTDLPLHDGMNAMRLKVRSPDMLQHCSYRIDLLRETLLSTPTVYFEETVSKHSEAKVNGKNRTVSIPVMLSSIAAGDVTVIYGIETQGLDNEATQGDDFQLLGSGSLEFDPCDGNAYATVEILDDEIREADERLVILLSSPANAVLAPGGHRHTMTIVDDDYAKVFFVDGASVIREDDDDDPVVKLGISHPVAQDVSVTVAVTEGNGVTPADYSLVSNVVTFVPGGPQEVSLNLQVSDDTDIESDEHVDFRLLDASGVAFGVHTEHRLIILDNESNIVYVKKNSTGKGTSWSDAYGDLQDALEDPRAVGGEVWIAGGDWTYTPSQTESGGASPTEEYLFVAPPNTVLRGGFMGTEATADERQLDLVTYDGIEQYALPTTLSGDLDGNGQDADDAKTILRLGGDAEVDGLVFAGAYDEDCLSSEHGAVRNPGHTIMLRRCRFRDNNTYQFGAAICATGGRTAIKHCVLCALPGSAPGKNGCNISGGEYEIADCAFGLQETPDATGQTGLFLVHSSGTAADCSFSNVSVRIDALEGLEYQSANESVFSNCTFRNNTDPGFDRVAVLYSRTSNLKVNACSFLTNNSLAVLLEGFPGGGGVAPVVLANMQFTNCLFQSNSNDYGNGAALRCIDALASIYNCTFRANSSAGTGGAVHAYFSQAGSANVCKVRNSILWANTGQENHAGNAWSDEIDVQGGICDIEHCDVQHPWGIGSAYAIAGSGNICETPGFLSGTDSHFANTSACVDGGEDANVPPGVTADRAGADRFVDIAGKGDDAHVVDMGAFETQD